ncbi:MULTISPECIES: LysR family transcriptional regulator [unclassified Pseudoalteromonas]|uniref:LysR family transcriptional regulator n=1 Tax=unclassified Pseudoalteromonas TaxID=194690 RepID=UPI000BBECDC6|nr:LysR family transcriptional regulator [Pseudoalteromonas sp. 1_2015MBL_MicDiv]ATG79718.1 hypothetical protein AOR04_19445 [Pseudoalteromonas sp. 1_2015MBL_MicDiv]
MSSSHLDDLCTFSLLAQHASLSATERETGIPKSNLSRALERLENKAGVPLFDRLPRGIRLTIAGDQLLAIAQMAERVKRDAEQTLRQAAEYPAGPLRIAASTLTTRNIVAPAMSEFLKHWPEVKPTLKINHAEIDPIVEDCDIFIRIGRPSQPYLVARKLFDYQMELWSSAPAMSGLDINDPEAIRAVPRVVTDSVMIPADWRLFHNSSGEQISLDEPAAALVGEPGTAYEMVKAGFGITFLPKPIACPRNGDEKLLRILPQWKGKKVEFFAVLPPHRTSVPAVRHFLDLLILRLGKMS